MDIPLGPMGLPPPSRKPNDTDRMQTAYNASCVSSWARIGHLHSTLRRHLLLLIGTASNNSCTKHCRKNHP